MAVDLTWRRRWEWFWPYLLLLFLVLGFFWDCFLTGKVFVLRDQFCGLLATIQYAGRALKTDEWFPLWNPFRGYGKPYLADPENGFFYPLHLIYYLFPTALAVTVSCSTHIYLAGASFYALARHWTLSKAPALLAAISLMFGTWLIANMEFRSLFSAFAWGPLELLVLSRMMVGAIDHHSVSLSRWLWLKAGSIAVLAGLITVQYLAGYPQIMLYTQLLATSLVGARCISLGSWRMLMRMGAAFAIATAMAGMLSMAQLLPSMEFIGLSERSVSTDPGLDMASMQPRHLLTLLLPYLFGRAGYPNEYWATTIFEFWLGTFYVGILPLLMLLYSPWSWRNVKATASREPRFFLFVFLCLITGFGLLMAMGKYTPLYELCYNLVPGFNHFRWPSKFLLLPVYALPLLAALGYQAILDRLGGPKKRCLVPPLIAVSCLWFILLVVNVLGSSHEEMLSWLTSGAFVNTSAHLHDTWNDYHLALIFFALSLALLSALIFLRIDRRWFATFVLATAFLNLFLVSRQIHFLANGSIMNLPSDAAPKLKDIGMNNVHSVYSSAGQYLYGSHDWSAYQWARNAAIGAEWQTYGISQSYQEGLKLERSLMMLQLFGQLAPQEIGRIADLMNIRYIVSGAPFPQILWNGAPKDVSISERTSCVPRAYVIGHWETLSDPHSALQRMLADDFNPTADAVLEPLGDIQPPLPKRSATVGNVKSLTYRWNSVDVRVTTSNDALLVVCDTWYPGWKATVDGKGAPIFRANLNFRAVSVPSGKHRIEFTYEPWQFHSGMWISVGTAFSVGILLVMRYFSLGGTGLRWKT